jgi:hypothetical protein
MIIDVKREGLEKVRGLQLRIGTVHGIRIRLNKLYGTNCLKLSDLNNYFCFILSIFCNFLYFIFYSLVIYAIKKIIIDFNNKRYLKLRMLQNNERKVIHSIRTEVDSFGRKKYKL